MSINIENNAKDQDNFTLGKIHYIPCDIQGDGDANVKQFFDPYIRKSDDGTLTASFRGHPLSGSTFPIPSVHNLTLVTEAKTPLGGETHRNFKVKGQVNSEDIIYWNWDTRPSQNDALYKATKWITLASALHEPLELEQKNDHLQSVSNKG